MADTEDWVDQVVDTDILVAGGAGAGSSAAIAAAHAGARVALAKILSANWEPQAILDNG